MTKLIRTRIDRAKAITGSQFFKNMIFLAIPVMVQNMLSSSLNFIDSIMVGSLGDASVSAVGLANQVYFLVFLFVIAVSGGSSMFISQFWGKKDEKNVRRIQGLGLIITVSVCALMALVSVLIPGKIMSFLSPDPEVVRLGSSFLRISAIGFVLFGVSSIYAVTLRNTGHPRVPLIANAAGVAVNTFLNYALIFGHFGFPRMGVEGSATATVVARIIECGIILGTVYTHKWPSSASIRQMIDVKRSLIRHFVSQSGIIVAKDIVWAIGIVLYNKTYASIGTAESAAVQVMTPVNQMAMVFFIGLSTSCQIMVGNRLGVNDRETAYKYAGRFLRIGMAGTVVVGALLFLLRHVVLMPYNVSDHARASAESLIMVWACYMPFAMFAMLSVVGILRSGGDTVFCLVVDTVAVYGIGMPLIMMGAHVWHLPVAAVFALVQSQEIFKTIVLWKRVRSGKWMRNLTRGIA